MTTDATVTITKTKTASVQIGAINIRDGRVPRLIAHDKSLTKAALRREVIRVVDAVLRTWKHGDEFVLSHEPIRTIAGNPQMARMRFQTGLIETDPEDRS